MKRTKNQAIMIMLPSWVPENTWQAFLGMRVRIKKPVTEYGRCLLIQDLVKLREQGEDPVAVINQSIKLDWAGLFEVKRNGNGHHGGKQGLIDSIRNSERAPNFD